MYTDERTPQNPPSQLALSIRRTTCYLIGSRDRRQARMAMNVDYAKDIRVYRRHATGYNSINISLRLG